MSFNRSMTAKIVGEEREGGYFFFYSDDLPGFSLMLSAEEAASIESVQSIVGPVAVEYMNALRQYEASKVQSENPRLRWLAGGNGDSFVGELCPA